MTSLHSESSERGRGYFYLFVEKSLDTSDICQPAHPHGHFDVQAQSSPSPRWCPKVSKRMPTSPFSLFSDPLAGWKSSLFDPTCRITPACRTTPAGHITSWRSWKSWTSEPTLHCIAFPSFCDSWKVSDSWKAEPLKHVYLSKQPWGNFIQYEHHYWKRGRKTN